MLPPLLLLAALHASVPRCAPACDDDALSALDDRLEDPSEGDRDELTDRQDALVRSSRARSIVVSFELHAWRRDGQVSSARGTSWLVTVQLRPEAWWLDDPAPRAAARPAARPRLHSGCREDLW